MTFLSIFLVLFFSNCNQSDSGSYPSTYTFNTKASTASIHEDPKTDVIELIKQATSPAITVRINTRVDASSSHDVTISYQSNEYTVVLKSKQFESVGIYLIPYYLGFKFYGPEDHWIYIPKLTGSDLNINKSFNQTFEVQRVFAYKNLGQKGMYEKSKSLFNRWGNRLLLHQDISLPWGHYGTSFNRKYKDQIENHPNWTKPPGRSWFPDLKLCYDKPEVANLFIQDAKERLQQKKNNGEKPPYYINVSPPDGSGGFCVCDDCGNQEITNSVFGLTNKIARALKAVDPNAYVTTMAYSDYAWVPTEDLEDNVIVGLVPDAFQNYGSPSKMLEDWEKKHNNLYLRGYVSLPLWFYDIPKWKDAVSYDQRIKQIASKNYIGYNYEVTPSFFSGGFSIFTIAQNSANTNFNVNQELDLFYKNMFPGYSDRIKKVFDALAVQPLPSAEIVKELFDLSQSTQDKIIQQRIEDILFYTMYLERYYAWKHSKSDENLKNLIDIIFADNNRLRIDSWGLYKSLETSTNQKIEFRNAPSSFTVQLPDPSSSNSNDLSEIIEKQNQEYLPKNKNWKGNNENLKMILSQKYIRAVLYNSKANSTIILPAKTKIINKNAAKVFIRISDPNGNTVFDQDLRNVKSFKNFNITLPEVGVYKFTVVNEFAITSIKVPKIPFAFTDKIIFTKANTPYKFYMVAPTEQLNFGFAENSGNVVVKEYPNGTSRKLNIGNSGSKSIELNTKEDKLIEISTYRPIINFNQYPYFFSVYPQAVWSQFKRISSAN